MQVLKFLVVALCYRVVASQDFIVSTTTVPEPGTSSNTNKTVQKLEIYSFDVVSDIKYRYARTLVSARVANPAEVSQDAYFTVVLPETAFISGFVMEVDGKEYKAYVKEKEEAKKIYDNAVQHGQTAAHVALTARDSNRFTVSVNLEPQKKVTFNLTYEELLSRKLGVYSDVINLDPGQIVPEFSVTVSILEASNITVLNVPPLKENNEIDNKTDETNALAKIERPTPQSAIVKFAPTPAQQKELATEGIKGQLIVEYDVDRSENPGEILVTDGYFVHFFSPTNLKPLNKHVTFVLDLSGSMSGRKIEQLRQAMTTILGDLNKGDLFSMVIFSQTAQVWDPTLSDEEMDARLRAVGSYFPNDSELPVPTLTPSVIAKVTPENIAKAKTFVGKFQALASTDIYDGLLMALEISKLNTTDIIEEGAKKPEPIIVFLTDGLPNVRVSDPDTIVSDVTKANTRNSSIFSLALGNDADFNFLKKLSLTNQGFARKIYEAADTALQLTDFYREIASPLLANVHFEYTPDEVENGTVTKHVFRRLFAGSELVVAGKLTDAGSFNGTVVAGSADGKTEFKFRPIIIDPWPRPYPPFPPILPHPVPVDNHTVTSMEKLWAYLTIQQLLEEDEAKDYDHNDKNQTSPELKKALGLALKYGFVTRVTSLVVVKPNGTNPVNTEDASESESGDIYHSGLVRHKKLGLRRKGFPMMAKFNGLQVNRIAFGSAGFAPGSFYLSTRPPAFSAFPPPPAPPPSPGLMSDSTTTRPICLATLSDVKWLPDNGTITLPTGSNNAEEVLQVASANETNTAYSSCTTPEGLQGHCRHLRYCVLGVFTANKDDFLPYFCHINSDVGVCCPDSNPPVCHP